MRNLLRITGGLSAVLFVVLAIISKGWLEPAGFAIFDAQFAGYSVDAARAYLGTLTADQTALYLGVFRWLDTVFPVLLAFTLGGIIWTQATGMQVVVRVVVALVPCVYLFLDLSENATVAHLLNTGPQVSPGAILQASATTVAKWISLTLVMLLAVWAWRLAPKRGAIQ